MNVKKNYAIEMQRILDALERRGERPRLLLHSCCAPCSSAVLERLAEHFEITVFYYNPNISPEDEFLHRAEEQSRLLHEMPVRGIGLLVGDYEPERFYAMAKGHEKDPEGGERCTGCFRLRLSKTAEVAREKGFDYFTTTLSISPLKDAGRLNAIGAEMAEAYGVPYLFSDFKKQNGYKRSCELSAQYGLYRQDYCGCVFSKNERMARTAAQDAFYGMRASEVLRPIHPDFAAFKNPAALYKRLLSLWSAQTCAPRMRERWTAENPTLGQCSVTAFLAQDCFGGDVLGLPLEGGGVHCYNRVGEVLFDLTNAQFGRALREMPYREGRVQSRESHFSAEEKKLRYEHLKRELLKGSSDLMR